MVIIARIQGFRREIHLNIWVERRLSIVSAHLDIHFIDDTSSVLKDIAAVELQIIHKRSAFLRQIDRNSCGYCDIYLGEPRSVGIALRGSGTDGCEHEGVYRHLGQLIQGSLGTCNIFSVPHADQFGGMLDSLQDEFQVRGGIFQ